MFERNTNVAEVSDAQKKATETISKLDRLISDREFERATIYFRDIESPRFANAVVSKLALSCDRDLLILFLRSVHHSELPQDRGAIVALHLSRLYLALNMAGSALRVIWPYRQISNRFERRLTFGDRRNIRYQIAQCLVRNNRLQEADQCLRGVLLFDPADTEALLALAAISRKRPDEYMKLVRRAVEATQGQSFRALSLLLDRLLELRRTDEFELILSRYFKAHQARPDVFLILANAELQQGSMNGYRKLIERYFDSFSLMRPVFLGKNATGFSDLGRPRHRKTEDGPLVSVVMTSHNSQEYITYAIQSVLDQSYRNFELHVVDDCSTDRSCEIVMQFAREDPRVRLHRMSSNVGTYVAKNSAIDACAGEYITFHDSDDWMHPERIARYVKKMRDDANLACLTSDWVRFDWDGRAIPRRTGGFSHLNPASTMYAAAALKLFGRFDEVRAGADSELMWRVRRNQGRSSSHHLKEPLGFGLHRLDSLTMNELTGFDENRYSRVRLLYWEAWSAWHLKKILKRQSIKLRGGEREFAAPEAMLVNSSVA